MEGKNTFKIWLFIIFILTIIIGGYFLMQKFTKLNNTTKLSNKNTQVTNTFKDIRIDNKKDYIYFTNEEMIDEDNDISFPKIVINFNDINNTEEYLNKTTDDLQKETKFDDNNELVSAHYPSYSVYYYDNYISIVCDYYTYDNKDEMIKYKNSKIYVFDKYTGELYTSGRLLSLFELSIDKVKQKVKNYVADSDLINGDEELDIDATLSGLSMDYLYVDKRGQLSISIVVKSSEKDYNDIVVLS